MSEQGSLWRDRSFLTLWLGQSASEMGIAITTIVLPLVAITVLDANTAEVGALKAMASIAVLLVAVPAGLYIDRVSKRRLMIACNVVRALVLLSIPVLALMGLLSMLWLYAAAFLIGAMVIIFGIAYHAYIPALVTRDHLPEANARIEVTESIARVGGPSAGSMLNGRIGGPPTLLVDAVLSLLSAVAVAFLPKDAPRGRAAGDASTTAPRGRGQWWNSVREGFVLLGANPPLARTALTTVGSMFCLSMVNAVFLYLLVVDLGLSPVSVAAVFFVGESGGLLAAMLASSIMRRVGSARIMWLAVFLSPAGLLLLLAPALPLVFAIGYLLLTSIRFVLFDISQYSYRQAACPLDKLGAITASIRFCIGAASAAGALVGGWLGVPLGTRGAILIATILMCVFALPVLFSGLRRTRDIEDLPTITVPEHLPGTTPAP
ncbi:MFS transporter [Nocardiopsis sp. YSL2]|uniref:MFS transporter n=1 Tax=Nocardiopsis sp. YSL2 TaxID=2939492 RepID=UPI0026F457EC|nr:MFS transporter [Nocardiopsis sp. YSL2]